MRKFFGRIATYFGRKPRKFIISYTYWQERAVGQGNADGTLDPGYRMNLENFRGLEDAIKERAGYDRVVITNIIWLER